MQQEHAHHAQLFCNVTHTRCALMPAVQARLPEIEELQKQLTATQAEATEASFKAQEEAAAAAGREATLTGEGPGWQGGGIGAGVNQLVQVHFY